MDNGPFSYSQVFEFTTNITTDQGSNFNCGITPEIVIHNQDPLAAMVINETFTAGDFPVTVKEVNGANGTFSGWGYIVVPYLEDTRLKVSFDNIRINTEYQLIDGLVVTDYDENWGGVEDTGSSSGNDTTETGDTDENNTDVENTDENSENGNTSDDGDSDAPQNETDPNDETSNDSDVSNENDSDGENTDNNNTGENTSNTDPANGDNTGNDNTNEDHTENATYITYNGSRYNDGDSIDINYSSSENNVAFKLDNYSENTENFKWTLFHSGSDVTLQVKNNEPIYDNFGINIAKRSGEIRLRVVFDDNKVEVAINVIKEDFKFIELYAKHKNNRIAKSGQILYLLDPAGTTNASKSIRFDVAISPNLPVEKISDNDITWYYEVPNQQTELGKDLGKKFIQRNAPENINPALYKVKAGYANKSEKEVTLEWVDEYRESYNIVPGAINTLLKDLLNNKINKIDAYLPGPVKFKTKFDITGERYNEKRNINRFLHDVQKGSLSASASIGVEMGIPGLSVQIPYIGTLGGYVNVNGSFGAEYEREEEKLNYKQDYEITRHAFGPIAQVCVELGAKVEILPGVDLLVFEVKAYGKSCIVFEGDLRINTNSSDELAYEVYFNPLVGGVSAEIKVSGYEVFDQSYEWYIFSRINIDKGEIKID